MVGVPPLRPARGAVAFDAPFALAVEVGDWHRFTGATIGSFVELVPSEFSLGQYRVQGPITKTGNGHARWVAFTQRRKRLVVANVAVARELAGWCWSLAVMDE